MHAIANRHRSTSTSDSIRDIMNHFMLKIQYVTRYKNAIEALEQLVDVPKGQEDKQVWLTEVESAVVRE